MFNQAVFDAQDRYCPVEEFKVRLNRKYFVSAKLAKLSKLKSREFRKHRYSARYKNVMLRLELSRRNVLMLQWLMVVAPTRGYQ